MNVPPPVERRGRRASAGGQLHAVDDGAHVAVIPVANTDEAVEVDVDGRELVLHH